MQETCVLASSRRKQSKHLKRNKFRKRKEKKNLKLYTDERIAQTAQIKIAALNCKLNKN